MKQIKLTCSSLLEPKKYYPQLNDLLNTCISEKGELCLTLEANGPIISVRPGNYKNTSVVVNGYWRSPLLDAQYQSAGPLVLIPFVLNIRELSFSHNCLFSIGRDERSLADLFMRNYFYAACRNESIKVISACSQADGGVRKLSKDLSRTYLWIVRANINDCVFNLKDVAEVILANTHAPLMSFNQPLLSVGASVMRENALSACFDSRVSKKRVFMHAREQMLSIYRG